MPPAPTRVWSSSINKIILSFFFSTSFNKDFNLSSKSPRNLDPAKMLAKSRENISLNQIKDAIKKNPDDIACIIIEPIQGEGGDNHFRPEFLNRIDETIVFNPLEKSAIHQIVKMQLNQLNLILEEKGIKLDITNYAIEYLAQKGFEPQYGARPIKRLVQKEILNGLSKELLKGTIKKGDNVLIDSFDENIVFRTNEKKQHKENLEV